MRPSLPIPCLCLATDRRICNSDLRDLEDRVSRAVAGGVNLVQLREKDLAGGPLLELALRIRQANRGSALLFINDRVDVAMACEADGVQLGEDAIPVSAARKLTGDTVLIGRSVHSLEGAVEAEAQGADFLVVGTIFSTPSHPKAKAAGDALLSRIAGACRLPFLGIGGINAGNAAEAIGAGAHGVAVISSILAAEDPEKAAREIKEAIDRAWQRSHPSWRQPSPIGREA